MLFDSNTLMSYLDYSGLSQRPLNLLDTVCKTTDIKSVTCISYDILSNEFIV